MDTYIPPEHLMKIKWCQFRDTSQHGDVAKSQHFITNLTTNLKASIHINRLISELLIEDEELNRTVMPKCCQFIPLFFVGKSILGCFE